MAVAGLLIINSIFCRQFMNTFYQSLSPSPCNRTLADGVYDMMVDAIIRGELPPGLRLIETDLAKRFDVSRGPLREAMRRLDERGLIVRHARHGARVTELSVKVLKLGRAWGRERGGQAG